MRVDVTLVHVHAFGHARADAHAYVRARTRAYGTFVCAHANTGWSLRTQTRIWGAQTRMRAPARLCEGLNENTRQKVLEHAAHTHTLLRKHGGCVASSAQPQRLWLLV